VGGVVVREARDDDAAGIARVHVRTWQHAYRGIVPDAYLDELSIEGRERVWDRELKNPTYEDHRVWVAERDETVVGFVNIGAARDADAPPSAGELYAIYVDPPSWGTRAGHALMIQAVEGLIAARRPCALLWVLEANPRARRFYELHGWYFDGTSQSISLGEDLTEIRYRIDLTQTETRG
jgi:ribosomal protein S18 acetylase RimI-like enzyme